MLSRTQFLSRLIGLYCIFIALSLSVHRQTTLDSVAVLLHTPSMMLVLGASTVVAGLAMVLSHNLWSDGTLAFIVTLAGWLVVAKGLLFLFLPPDVEADFFMRVLHYQQFFYEYMAGTLVIGICLTYGGFSPSLHSQTAHDV